MALHVATLLPSIVLQPSARGVERLADRRLNVLVMLSRDGELAARDLKVDANDVLVAFPLVAPAELEDHATACDMRVIVLELFSLFADGVVEGVGMSDAVEGDLEWYLH